jgi:hypothetical protein
MSFGNRLAAVEKEVAGLLAANAERERAGEEQERRSLRFVQGCKDVLSSTPSDNDFDAENSGEAGTGD